MNRIAWLDSCNMPSHIHKTDDGGVTTHDGSDQCVACDGVVG